LANLGAVLRVLRRDDEAEAAYGQAIALDPRCASAHHNLANLFISTGRRDAAEAAYRAAIRCLPSYAQAWNGLGLVLQNSGRMAEAADAYRLAVGHAPNWPEPRINYGVALLNLEQGEAAAQAFRAAIELDPQNATAHGNLGAVYVRGGLPMRAEASLRTAVAIAPGETRWRANLAVALQMQGRHLEAEQCCREVMMERPGYASAHGNLLFALNYREDLGAGEIFAEYRNWDARHAAPLAPRRPRFDLDRTVGRRLRVGYVSPDFRHHAVAFFAEPLIAAHDPVQVEVFCYSEVMVEDATTLRLRNVAAHWRSTLGMTDEAVADLIRDDRIDVLVDLAGHTAANRLLVFARRAAPVQVASLLGHGYTSGLSAMDGILVDDDLAPPGSEPLFSETLVRIGRVPLVYRPQDGMPPVAPLPVRRNGYVTFGHFGRPERLNPGVISAWARILHGVPGARLMLNTRAMQEAAFREAITAQFAGHGIVADRLQLVFTQPQPRTWAAYGEIDIALDPFPHNAGTTTIEALWQGVPVVTLAGRPSVGRIGASILRAVGLMEWVAPTIDDYIECAVAAAGQLDGLAALRADLRARMRRSPLCDAAGLARRTEEAYRALWERWRAGDGMRLRQFYGNGEIERARTLARRMLGRDSDATTALHVQALIALGEGRATEAADTIGEAAARAPEDAELRSNQAVVLRRLGRLDEAAVAARAALRLAPASPPALNNLANILRDAGQLDESAACYRAALNEAPGFADAWANLAWVLALNGQAVAAEDAARRAIGIDGRHANGFNNLGLALMRQGRLDEAETALRQALALRPDFALPHSNLLFCLNYRTDLAAAAIAAEYRAWDRRHAAALVRDVAPYSNDRTPNRRLRVGYVSPDFRHHAVAFFAEPLMAAHDPAEIELFCYAEVPTPDAVTARFQALAACFVSTVGLTDAQLADRIRADRIDVLVDLAGHTGGNRLLAFARRPAPVQVATMLGLGTTSGLSAMDAFIADRHLVPPGAEDLFSEPVVRLDRVPLAYRAPEGMPLVGELPALANGHVTFGHFGRTIRLNDGVLRAWARILAALPSARLRLNTAPFAEAEARARFSARFADLGGDAERLDLVFTSPQSKTWEDYGRVDIGLDPFPHNAGTTTMEALWQGVPVVSLADRPGVGRIGAMLLDAVGLEDWVAQDVDTYVERAVRAAVDVAGLGALRAGLRTRVATSPLGDAAGLARAFETVYRRLWRDWCLSAAAPVPR
jgi:predicted O-linked N-acetylglucosamine transferase (SPINDLY family)